MASEFAYLRLVVLIRDVLVAGNSARFECVSRDYVQTPMPLSFPFSVRPYLSAPISVSACPLVSRAEQVKRFRVFCRALNDTGSELPATERARTTSADLCTMCRLLVLAPQVAGKNKRSSPGVTSGRIRLEYGSRGACFFCLCVSDCCGWSCPRTHAETLERQSGFHTPADHEVGGNCH